MADSNGSFTWYGHSCVELRTPGGKTLIFDPWFGNPTSPRAAADVKQCDLMLVSHGHFDHIGSAPRDIANADALTIARATKPTWVAIHELSLWLETQLDGAGVEIIGMNKGGTVNARGLNVTMVHADHSAGDWAAPAQSPMYLGEPVAFVIELEDGMRVLFAGDTDVYGDMKLLGEMHRPDVAFLPIGGHYTMGPAGAARAAAMWGVRAVVPIHYGTFPILAGTPDQLRSELLSVGASVDVVAPERGLSTPLP